MHRISRRSLLLALGAGACAPSCRGACQSTTQPPERSRSLDVHVYPKELTGPFVRLSGVQGSSYPLVAEDADHRARYREHHVERVRFPQDCAPNTLTLGGIFPDERADPDNPASYRFSAIDQHMRAAREAGAEILWQSSYDVGQSDRWVGLNLGGRAPADQTLWSRVVERCLKHFNNGWADGTAGAVRYVEFVNEPNGLGGFGGRLAELPAAFVGFLKTIERYNRDHADTMVRAVGPGIPLSFAEWAQWRPRFELLLEQVKAANLQLPVFSFHTYGDDVSPLANARLATALRVLLNERGLAATELWNTEWQGGDYLVRQLQERDMLPASPNPEQLARFASGLAAYALTCKVRWQDTLRGAFYYRANRRDFPEPHKSTVGMHGGSVLFSPSGEVRPLALQEDLTYLIQQRVPNRCRTVVDDSDGLCTALGLASQDGKETGVLLCNLATEPRTFRVHLHGVSPGTTARSITLGPSDTAIAEQQGSAAASDGSQWTLEETLDGWTSRLWLARSAS